MRCTVNCYKSNSDSHKYFTLKKIEEGHKRENSSQKIKTTKEEVKEVKNERMKTQKNKKIQKKNKKRLVF